MREVNIKSKDILIEIESDYSVSFTHSASYSDRKTLDLTIDFATVLSGNEKMTITLNNDAKFRADDGGCVQPQEFEANLTSSLTSVADSAGSASGFTMYFVMLGILCVFGILIL